MDSEAPGHSVQIRQIAPLLHVWNAMLIDDMLEIFSSQTVWAGGRQSSALFPHIVH